LTDRLRDVEQLMNAYEAVGGPARGRRYVTRFRRYVEGFAKRFDTKLRTQIRSITGANPW